LQLLGSFLHRLYCHHHPGAKAAGFGQIDPFDHALILGILLQWDVAQGPMVGVVDTPKDCLVMHSSA
jgi:hypothetical protein